MLWLVHVTLNLVVLFHNFYSEDQIWGGHINNYNGH
jgi:hypothetical protein